MTLSWKPLLFQWSCNEVRQACCPSSAFLVLWSRGENEDHTLAALRVAVWSMEAPEGWSTPALEKRTAHSTHLCQGMGRGHVFVCSHLTV